MDERYVQERSPVMYFDIVEVTSLEVFKNSSTYCRRDCCVLFGSFASCRLGFSNVIDGAISAP